MSTIKIKRGLYTNLLAIKDSVQEGELLVTTDSLDLYLGKQGGGDVNKLTGKSHSESHLSTGLDPIQVATSSSSGLMSSVDKVKLDGLSNGSGDVYSKYQILDNTNSNSQIPGCYVIATGQVYGNKEGTDGSFKTLRVKIPIGVKVKLLNAYFTGTEIGATSKYGVVLFDTTSGYSGMPNNGTSPVWPEFIFPQVQAFNGSSTTRAQLPSVVPVFSTDGATLNLNAIAIPHTTGSASLIISVSF